MSIKHVIINLILIGLNVINVNGELSDFGKVLEACEEVRSESNPFLAYLGWPFGIRCQFVFHDKDVVEEYSSGDDSSSYNCSIFSSDGKLLYHDNNSGEFVYYGYGKSEYTIPEVHGNETEYLVALNNTYSQECFFLRVHLNVISTPNQTCEEFVESNMNETDRNFLVNQYVKFNCVDDVEKSHIDVDNSEFLFEWKHNCQNFPNNKGNEISFYLNQDHIGNYACSVTYNGMTRYILYQAVCLKQNALPSELSFVCDKIEALVLKGDDVAFTCNATFGIGNLGYFDVFINWQKGNSTSKRCMDVGDAPKNALCTVAYSDFDRTCLQNPNDNVAEVVFTLRNIDESSYGEYVLHAITNNVDVENKQVTLFVKPNTKLEEERKNLIIGVCIGVLLFFIIMSLIAFYNLIYLQVYFKRYFGKAIPDFKRYDVFLVYHYSKDFDTFAKKDIKDFVTKISKLLQDMGYTVYDQKREPIAGDTAEYLEYTMKNSHRILIFLTPEFIKDDWSFFSLQAGFKEMVDSGTKLIFVLLPGVKEHVKQKSKIETEYKYIESAMKINHVIQWPRNNTDLSKRSIFKLEYALPKLNELNKTQLFSISSGGENLSHINGNYQKQESVMTVYSDLSV